MRKKLIFMFAQIFRLCYIAFLKILLQVPVIIFFGYLYIKALFFKSFYEKIESNNSNSWSFYFYKYYYGDTIFEAFKNRLIDLFLLFFRKVDTQVKFFKIFIHVILFLASMHLVPALLCLPFTGFNKVFAYEYGLSSIWIKPKYSYFELLEFDRKGVFLEKLGIRKIKKGNMIIYERPK